MRSLDAWRQHGDPLADLAVSGDNHDMLALHEAAARIPDWVDFERMEVGRRAFLRNAPFTVLVLVAGSLVESFCAAKGAKVLRATGRLEREPLKRVYETASFVRDTLLPEGVGPGTPGHRAAVRVRLLHAHARRYVQRLDHHDEARDGVAINQEDMAHTLTLFSHVVMRGVGRLGGNLSPQEQDSYAHMWRWLGYVLGVDEALLPRSYAEEKALYRRITSRVYAPSEDSRALTFAVLDAVAGQPPFFLPRRALYAVSRRVIGDPLADAIGLPRAWAWNGALGLARGVTRGAYRVARAAPLSDRALSRLGGAFVEANRARVFSSMPLPDYRFKTSV